MRPSLPKAAQGWWIAVVVLALLPIRLHAAETSYWVWGKRPALSDETRSLLTRQGVRKIYRQVATVDGVHVPEALLTTWSVLKEDATTFAVVPVIRVEGKQVPKLEFFEQLRARFPALQGDTL